MKDYDINLSTESIIESIKKDSLNRNAKISKFISLLNNIECNKIIAIDGRWGCGKTVFLKQIEIINKEDIQIYTNINNDDVKKFKEKYMVYYYNAWQNDYHTSPLLSLIYNFVLSQLVYTKYFFLYQ